MRVLITGAGGQLATELVLNSPPDVVALAVSKTDCDITLSESVARAFDRFRPETVINTAAFTAVDRAEAETDSAFAVNEIGVLNLARASRRYGARLIHISTDYVFGGERSIPYTTTSPVSPVNVYGASKARGEVHALGITSSVVVRTGWVDFAVKIRKIAIELGLVTKSAIVQPVRSTEYPTAARRPTYSVLDCSGSNGLMRAPPDPWRDALRDTMREIKRLVDVGELNLAL